MRLHIGIIPKRIETPVCANGRYNPSHYLSSYGSITLALPCYNSTASLTKHTTVQANVDTSGQDKQVTSPNELVSRLAACRDPVLAQWRERAVAEIPTAMGLGEPVLLDMLPTLYDKMTDALAAPAARPHALADTNLANAHGRERANMTNYAPDQLLHELQIFRDVFFATAAANGIRLGKRDAEIIGRSIEEAARDSISGFSEASRELNESFITSLSHDLRNPLHVASTTAQLIQLKTSDPAIIHLAQRIARKLSEADAMIQTLLDAALLHGRMKLKLHLSSFDIMSLVEEVCADMPILGQHVDVTGERIVGHWCRTSLKRVLENLLSNAHKYGDPAQATTVRLARQDDMMLMAVHNEGKPIPRMEMERLFKPYERIDEAQVRGWGLGLPYVQNVAESHGGSVIVDSAAGRGTTFTVSVPVDARPYANT